MLSRSSPWLARCAAVLGAGLAYAATAHAGAVVKVLVLKEHGVGTASASQPFLDKFIAQAAGLNGWDGASTGRYTVTRDAADAYINSDKPQFAIFSLPAFLATRKTYNLDVVGEAKTDSGGEIYYVVSTTQGSLAECKSKRLATDHMGNPDEVKFIEKVVARGAFVAGDFQLVTTTRFGQAGTKVLNSEAECALIHDAQLASLKQSPGGNAIKTLWTSPALPGMAVVAFPTAGAIKGPFQTSLPNICQGSGAGICKAVGVLSLSSGSNQNYQQVISLYP